MLKWCVAQTKPHEEDIAINNLQRQEFRVFLPRLREHKGKEVRLVPMFSRYIFVQIETDDMRWAAINSTRGVSRLMMSNIERPSLLPEGWVEMMIEKGAIVDTFLDAASFLKGEEVEFVTGPFNGHRGICQWTNNKRVALLLDILGRKTVVYSDCSTLRPTQKSQPLGVR
jgi:transcriptional antiterminator RfaH